MATKKRKTEATSEPPWNPTVEEFAEHLKIDKGLLDDQIEQQPDLVYRVGEGLSLAISRRDLAKKSLDEIEAEIAIDLREEAANTHSKITDKEVEMRVRDCREVRAATKVYLDAKFEVSRWQDLKTAFEARGYALRELVELYVNDYFASSGSISTRRMRDTDGPKWERK